MQTSKSRSASLNVPQKTSPATPRNGWKIKTPGSDSDPLSSPSPVRKTPKSRSPNIVDRRSPRSPAAEPIISQKKRPGKVSELESQLAHLQDELKKAKDQLSSSESCKKKAQQEAEEAKNQFAAVLAELDKTQKQLKEFSDSEDARIQELRKISQDRDKAWQSELEAVQKQHTMDSAALASALNEIQRLRIQSDKISESEARHAESAHAEIHSLRVELTKTLELVGKLKGQLNDSRESEARALEEFGRAQVLFEVVKNIEETLKLENGNVKESYKSLVVELEESKNKVNSLEGLVSKFQSDLANSSKVSVEAENGECDQTKMLETELNDLKHEASRLMGALEGAERRYQDQHLEMTAQVNNANELVKQTKMESCEREAELEAALKELRTECEELKTKLTEKANELQNELNKSESVLEDLKATLSEKELRLQSLVEENETLKSEMANIKAEKSKENLEALASAEAARAAEQESLLKLGNLTEEADKNSQKVARLTEQLDAAQACNSEMEAELRRLKVQSDQWRKAAEAAAAILSSGNNNNNSNGKYVEKMGSLEFQTIGGKLGSPFSDEESPAKKNGNMLKKIGVLLKKGQK